MPKQAVRFAPLITPWISALLALSACDTAPTEPDGLDTVADVVATKDTGEDPGDTADDAVGPRDTLAPADAEDTGASGADTTAPDPVPSVRGTASVRVGALTVAAPGLTVWLRRVADGAETATRRTNVFGDFVVSSPILGEGDWVVCSAGDGLSEGCDPEAFPHDGHATQVAAPEHVRDAPAGSVVGRARLADGTPCVYRFPLHGIAVDTEVEAAGAEGTRTARANVRGEFVLFGVAVGGAPVTAKVRCEALEVSLPLTPGELGELVLDNHPPVARGLVARDAEGAVVEVQTIDAPLTVAVSTEDPDGDPLTVRWATNRGPVAGEPKASTVFTPGADTSDLEAVVGDGRGGYDLVTLALFDTPRKGATGRVVGPQGEAIVGAVVRHGEHTTTTDEGGAFRLEIWAPDQPMIVSARGFVDQVVVADHPPRGAEVAITPCATTTFDATARVDLVLPATSAEPAPAKAAIPAAALVDAAGAPFVGEAEACFAHLGHAHEDDPLPLGALSTAGDAAGKARVASLSSFVWLDVRDGASGARLAFAPSAVASVEMPLSEAESGSSPRLMTQAAGAAAWTTGAALAVGGGRVNVKLPAPGGAGVGVDEEYGCLRVWLGDLRALGGPKALRWRALATATAPQTAPVAVPVTPGLDVLGPLPARRAIKVEVLDLTTPHHTPIAEWTRVLSSGSVALAPASPLGTRIPYDRCGGDLVLPPPRPVTGVEVLSRYELQDTIASDGTLVTAVELAEGYRKKVDAESLRPTPSRPVEFWEFNDMGTGFFTRFDSQAKLAYQRRFDLPFGRQIAIKNDAAHLLMYDDLDEAIAVDQTSGGDVVNRMFGLVVRGSGAARRPVFFAYRNMARTSFFDLGSGMKAVPTLCQNCHGGDRPDLVALADSVVATTMWPSTQVHAHPIPVLLDTLDTYRHGANAFQNPSLAGSYGRAALEDDVRSFNERLRQTGALSPAAEEQLAGSYGGATGQALPPQATQDDDYVAPDWSAAPTLYQEVVRPYCRSCHMQLDGALGFTSRDDFRAFASLIHEDVCQTRSMPHAPGPSLRFWGSSNPWVPALLDALMQGTLGWPNAACVAP